MAGMSGGAHRVARATVGVIVSVSALLALVTNASARTIYVSGTSGVAALTVNSNGTLTPVTGSPFAAGTNPDGLALTADGARLYVANQGTNNISAYRVRTDGGLDSVGAPTPSGGAGPIALASTPDGQRLYVVNSADSVSAFNIAADGSLSTISGSPFTTAPTVSSPRVPSISADGRLLFVPGNGTTNVAAMQINQDGTLSAPGTEAPTGGTGVVNTALAPNANRIYVNNWFNNSIAAFNFDSAGNLTPVTGTPFTTGGGTQPMALRPSLSGTRLYATLMQTDQVAAMTVGPDGALTAGPAVAAGANDAQFLAQTADGLRLYASIDAAPNNVFGFNIAPAGTLAAIAGSPFTSGAGSASFQSIAATPNQGPNASLSVTAADRATQAVSVDGAASSDADGSIATYTFDYGDGTVETSTTSTGVHTYAAPGTYSVRLTVTDNEGCSTTVITTGQTASCNGTSKATAATDVDLTTPIPPSPSNQFGFGKLKRNKDKGTATLAVDLPGPGSLDLSGKNLKPQSLTVTGDASLKIKPKGKTKKKLKRKGKAKVKAMVTFTPTGGTANSLQKPLKLKYERS